MPSLYQGRNNEVRFVNQSFQASQRYKILENICRMVLVLLTEANKSLSM